MTSKDAVREVTRIIIAHYQTEGAGFTVRRPIPTAGFDMADPSYSSTKWGRSTFVMNTEQEIMQAMHDAQSGRMGEITRTAAVH